MKRGDEAPRPGDPDYHSNTRDCCLLCATAIDRGMLPGPPAPPPPPPPPIVEPFIPEPVQYDDKTPLPVRIVRKEDIPPQTSILVFDNA